jgi:hypothetical protein
MHSAAQAEYTRLAALAYSPSDAISQARVCLAGIEKVQSRPHRTLANGGIKCGNHVFGRSQPAS